MYCYIQSLHKVWFHLFLMLVLAAWQARQIVVRNEWWADMKHSSSALVAISQQLKTGHTDRLCLPHYYVSQGKASQRYLEIRPLTNSTWRKEKEGKWKTDKGSSNKHDQLLRRICSFLLVLSCRLIFWQNVTPELAGAVIMSVEMKMIQRAKTFTVTFSLLHGNG